MRRLLVIAAVLVSVSVAAVGLGAGEEDGSYEVRAIFENAAFVIPGEDVKVSGVKVGSISEIDITEDFKAVVVLDITDPGYQDFREDALCIVRPQSLIGEKFVECEPTAKRAPGEAPAAKLERIPEGEPGAGQYLLPVERTRRSVDLDLLNTIYRRPFAERFTIILNELGVGLAGRGKDLNDVIKRSVPALEELDQVLRILADQNQVLRRLAVDSDRILAPLAREREHVSGFIENASEVAEATAERRGDLEASIERLPRFLQELRPTMTRLQGLADEATPVLSDLGDVAPEVSAFIRDLGPFSEAAVPALDTLGDAAAVGGPALEASLPTTRDLRAAAVELRPVAEILRKVLVSLDGQNGFQRIMDYIFFQAAAVNGFDAFGHYLRAALVVNTCSVYATTPVPGCSANFSDATSSSVQTVNGPRDKFLERVRRILAGETLEEILGDDGARKARRKSGRVRETAKELQERSADAAPPTTATPPGAGDAPAAEAPAPADDDSVDTLLDYLFGGGG